MADPSASPSNRPSESPTNNPTESPTSIPSMADPSASPSNHPSESPTNTPIQSPTSGPSNRPSESPTNGPILVLDIETIININVTITGTNDAIVTEGDIVESVNTSITRYLQTLSVDVDYEIIYDVIANKITNVTIIAFDVQVLQTDYITSADINDEDLQNKIQKDLSNEFGSDIVYVVVKSNYNEILPSFEQKKKTFFQEIIIIIGICLLFIILISLIDAWYIRPNDFYNIGVLLSAAFHILDTFSDVFFALTITYYSDFKLDTALLYIFIASISFIIVPMIITLAQLKHIINKHWNKSDELRSWLSTYIYILYIISILCGSSFTGVTICRSNMFNQPIFDIPLTKQDASHFNIKKLYSITLLEVYIKYMFRYCKITCVYILYTIFTYNIKKYILKL